MYVQGRAQLRTLVNTVGDVLSTECSHYTKEENVWTRSVIT
jgi:hypothetical protein